MSGGLPSEAGPGPVASPAWPASRTAWYAVFVLALTVLFANLDLTIVALLVEPMKRDLDLSDVQVSLLLGFAFAVFYTFIGLPVARYIDRSSRTRILAIGLAVWSAATVFCGLARGFWQLFLGRVLVGAGESVNGPATFSLIADSFPPERLPRAIAVMQLGVVAGSGLSLLLGGVVIHLLAQVAPIALPGVGLLKSWQLVFIVIGLPGLAVAVLMTTVREPARRGLAALARREVSLTEVVRYLADNWRVFGPMFLGLTLGALSLGAQQWMPAFYQRTYGWEPARVGSITGIMRLIATPLGLLIGVWLAERLTRLQRDDAALRVVVLARLVGVPAAIALPLMPTPWLALGLDAVVAIALGAGGASQNAALQIVTPNQIRGQVTALYLFIYNVVGLGLGPTLAAVMTQYVFHAESELRYALCALAASIGPLALIIIWSGIKPYAREVARLRSLLPQPHPG
jgi:MFS family permease